MSHLLSRLSYRSAGESHGSALTVILEGVPRGLALDTAAIDAELQRRQGGAGRGGRQRLEHDRIEVLGGLRRGVTIGSPLCLQLPNRDATIEQLPEPTRPRPGHADLAGCYRHWDRDIRSTLERASARETAARVAAAAVARQFLTAVGCELLGFVRSVGGAHLPGEVPGVLGISGIPAWRTTRDRTLLYTLAAATDAEMLAEVKRAGGSGDTRGGVVEVHAVGVLAGLGSCFQWHERLDARLGAALFSIPAIKGVEIGLGFAAAARLGSEVHDEIVRGPDGGLTRGSNRAGGLEGGMTNGQDVVVRAAMKPLPSLKQPLASIDLATGETVAAGYERSDVCAVSAASVVAEAMVALVLADATLTRLGGDSMREVLLRCAQHRAEGEAIGRPPGRG